MSLSMYACGALAAGGGSRARLGRVKVRAFRLRISSASSQNKHFRRRYRWRALESVCFTGVGDDTPVQDMKLAFLNDGIYAYASGFTVRRWRRGTPAIASRAGAHRAGWAVTVGVRDMMRPGERKLINGVEFVGIDRGPNTFGVVLVFIVGAAGLVVLAVRISSMGRCSRSCECCRRAHDIFNSAG